MRIGARMLRRAPGFAAAAILTIGLGTGAATAVFSVVNGVLLRPLPYPESDRLVRLYQLSDKSTRMNVSGMNFDDWQARTHSFASMASFNWWGLVPAIGGTEPTMALTAVVSREFFDVMQVRPFKGRTFAPDEQRVGGTPAVVVELRVLAALAGRQRARRPRAPRRRPRLHRRRRDACGLRLSARARPSGSRGS